MSRQAQDISEGIRRLESHTAQIMEESNARGIAVGVVDRTGRILYEKYFGLRDAEKGLPINRDTIFGMASVTKSFTALSIMQMQRDGILSVEDADRKSTRLNSSHRSLSRMPSSA